ncbi:MAG: hypothetical protein GF355_09730, partial [Candidatus Eisenbacteria bacterium]|nr:hypothetical protein [Candidatus Eisenbacteria bacterium]
MAIVCPILPPRCTLAPPSSLGRPATCHHIPTPVRGASLTSGGRWARLGLRGDAQSPRDRSLTRSRVLMQDPGCVPQEVSMSRSWRFWLLVIVLAVFLAPVGNLAGFLVDWLWFRSEGYAGVFWKMFWSKAIPAALVFVLSYAFLALNLHVARRRSGIWGYDPYQGTDISLPQVRRIAARWGWLLPLFIAFLFAAGAARHWLTLQAYFHQAEAGLRDPIFDRDIAFYFFSLPLFNLVKGWLLTLVITTLIGTAAAYFLLGGLLVGRRLAAAPRVHLACLGLLIAVLYAWKYWLSR